jgi:maltose alpha-D-glucosyltransferase/alpha-amylase
MTNEELWYKNAVFYEVYVRAFYDSNGDGIGDLRGLMQRLDYFQEIGIDCLWLLPIYPSPLEDDGYDIADYYGVLPEYGNLDDFKALLEAAHARGLRVVTDLVLNHTSHQHPWFQAARCDKNSPYRDYYVWSDTDDKYKQARIIFLDTEKSNWSWDDQAGQYFWHRFYSSQPDLNYGNLAVQEEMLKVVKFWLDLGVDGFRVDAVPYLFEREGTNCENLPETHAYLKRLRRFVDENYPGRVLLCEANQWPKDVRPYFGDGDEFQMGFNFPVMPRIFMSVRKGDREPLVWIMDRIPTIPDSCQWCTFLRNHDELTLEMVTEEERQWMWQEYAPEPRMRLNLGIRRRLAPLLDNDRRKIEMANSLLFSLPGSPIVYYGDEIGMGDNIWLTDRDGVRTPMQWDDSQNGGFSEGDAEHMYSPIITGQTYGPQRINVAAQRADPNSLWHTIRRMIAVRKANPVFCCGDMTWAETGTDAVTAYWREKEGRCLLILNNLTDASKEITVSLVNETYVSASDLLSNEQLPLTQVGFLSLVLEPYQYRWLSFD